MENVEKLVYSREVIEFTAVANEYCKILESLGEATGVKLLRIEQKLLPLLYYKTLAIPSFEPVIPDEMVERFTSEEEWNSVDGKISKLLGDSNDYLELEHDKHSGQNEPVQHRISENLADIYQDLKDFVIAYNIGTIEIMNDALWECLENFRLYWGTKLVSSIRAIHFLMLEPEKIKPSEESDRAVDSEERDTSDWILSRRQQEYREHDNEDL
jgi:hypothetical protein